MLKNFIHNVLKIILDSVKMNDNDVFLSFSALRADVGRDKSFIFYRHHGLDTRKQCVPILSQCCCRYPIEGDFYDRDSKRFLSISE